jgi:D-aspartate ligase
MPRENPQRAAAGWPAAVIAGAYQTGVLAVRSLQRRGVRALCFDCVPTFPGFKSVYGPARHSPDPDTEPRQWLEFMIELAKELGDRPALMASSDKFVTAIARHARELAPHYRVSPGTELQGLLAEKQTQYDLCRQHGMPLPYSRYVKTLEEVRASAAEVSYPCLFKPTHFREWQKFPDGHPLRNYKLAMCDSPEHLLRQYELVKSVTPDVIVQEIIQGPDTNKRVYMSIYDVNGRRIGNALMRSLRCEPVQFGPASVTEPVVDEETDRVCDSFLRSIGYRGICEIEMKWDDRDGRVKIIEANPRLSGGGDAAPYAGVDQPWIHYLDLIGQEVEPVKPDGKPFKHIVLRADAVAIPAYWRAGLLDFKGLISSYRGPRAYFDLDWRDFRYSLQTVVLFGKYFLRELFSGMFKKRGN